MLNSETSVWKKEKKGKRKENNFCLKKLLSLFLANQVLKTDIFSEVRNI